jgi:hypothetical protein
MPLVKLTISEEPFEVEEGEVPTLEAQGLLEKVLEDPAAPPAKPQPAQVQAPAAEKKD